MYPSRSINKHHALAQGKQFRIDRLRRSYFFFYGQSGMCVACEKPVIFLWIIKLLPLLWNGKVNCVKTRQDGLELEIKESHLPHMNKEYGPYIRSFVLEATGLLGCVSTTLSNNYWCLRGSISFFNTVLDFFELRRLKFTSICLQFNGIVLQTIF